MSNYYLCNTAALSSLSKTGFKVYTYIAMSANNKTRQSFKSKRTIATDCKISLSSVTRAIKELCSAGLLSIKARYNKSGRQTSNLYTLLDSPQTRIEPNKPNSGDNGLLKSFTSNSDKSSQKVSQDKIRLFKCSSSPLTLHLSAIELKILTYLKLRAGKSSTCFPSKKEIAAYCKISVSTVFRSIKRLYEKGIIEITAQNRKNTFGNNGSSANLYTLTDCIQDLSSPRLKPKNVMKLLFTALFLINMTPSPVSFVTPQETSLKTKATLKQRKNKFITKLVKWYRHNKFASRHSQLANCTSG